MSSLRLDVRFRDAITPDLARRIALLRRPDAVLLPVARKGAADLRRHYRAVDARKPNALGGARTHWWRKVAESVQAPVLLSPTAASVSVDQPGIVLRLRGGWVQPRQSRFLAVPISRESHGIWARDWENRRPGQPLRPIRSGSRVFLAAPVADSRGQTKRERAGASSRLGARRMLVLYVLLRRVYIPKDADALPPEPGFSTGLRGYAERRWMEVQGRQGGAS